MDIDNNIALISIIILIVIIIIILFLASNNNIDTNTNNVTVNNINLNEVLILKSNPDPLKINISDYKSNLDLFNLSVVRLNNKYIGLIRCHNKAKNYSYPSYIEIDDDNNTSIKSLDFNDKDFYSCNDNGIEDPRIFQFKNENWGIANCLGYKEQKYKCTNTMCIFKLNDPKTTFKLLYHPENPKLIQKNWSPFVYNDKLYCEYTIDPHVIYEIDSETGIINNIINSDNNYKFNNMKSRLSGGAPPILISHFREPIYLSIGHVRLSNSSYYHFFYIFQSYPPFNIIGSSEIFKLDDKERIQFVGGLSVCDDKLYVSYGINDKYNKISTFNIYDINYKIKYDHKYINSIMSKSLNYKHKLTIVINHFNNFDKQELQKYCDKYEYKLQDMDSYNKSSNEMTLFLYRSMMKIEKLNINHDISFDNILNMAGDSKYICFEGLNDRFMSQSFLNSNIKDEYNLITYDDFLNIINLGYPYRKNEGFFLHKNYLHQILYSEKSMFNDDITVMPNIIKSVNKSKKSNKTKIPKIIHQSFESRVLPECLSSAVHTWLNLNPDYEYRYYDNGDRRQLIKDYFDDNVLKAYDMLIPGAYRCDLFRFCAVYIYGGIYADIKNGAVFPIKNIINSDVDYLLINDTNDDTMYNAFFGAKSKDPIIYKVIITIVKRILNKEYGPGNLYPTGPMAMGSVILKEFEFNKHMKVGKYKINNSTVCVYDHHNDGNNGRIILDKNDSVLINTRHNTKTLDQEFLKSITGNSNYGVLWDEKRIYRNI
jgi:mannosyltransferase OCH1-like enzyme/predicted GH43/DUF377 family glycosyl hydrolase